MDSDAVQTTLPADIGVAHFRARRLDVPRWLALVAWPLWYQVASQQLPDPGPRRGHAGWRWSTLSSIFERVGCARGACSV
jgi:hypothetical protein